MSLPRPSGLKAPSGSKLARPGGGIPQKSGLMQPGSLSRAQSAIAKSARAAGMNSSVAERYAADTAQALAGEEELAGPPPPLDDFIIGDHVFVSGSKPGFIAFLGETQFAPGEWAGVVLDETIGKNDGSVNGVRYFQCEPKRGVFCRISKLSRTPGIAGAVKSTEDGATSEASMPVNGDNTPVNKRPTTPSMMHRPTTPSHGESRIARPTTPSLPRTVNKSLSSSNTSLNRGHAPAKVKSDSLTSTPAAGGIKHNLNIGDRVLVSGSKLGTLRYLGPTDFAKGEWAGVELDDPVGKNDGAVAGKRYFDCRPRYGLFAPVHKVTKTSVTSTPNSMSRSVGSTGMRLSRERSGSQESVSSMSSATSSASRPRVRLGVSGLGNNQPAAGRSGQRPSSLNITATTSALQKALKEKEEHIEQLLRERDLERSEVARAAAQVEEAQDQLTQLRAEKERLHEGTDESIQQLKAKVQKLASEKHDLEEKLDDEKRKVEDLQFQIEEEVISKDDLESRTEEEEAKIRELEKSLKREKEKTEKLETEMLTYKTKLERHDKHMKSMEETQTSYLDQIEELTHKLTQAELKITTYDSSRLEEGAKTSQVSLELEEKTNKVSELEDFLSMKNKEVKQLQEKLSEMKDELESRSNKLEKIQYNFEELTDKLKANEVFSNNLSLEVQNLKSRNSDLERQLKDNQERYQQLNEEKSHLESQVADMMKNSGDSSNQLSMLNDQLGQKNRKLEEVQADLSTSTQKWHNLNNKFETSMREKEREIENLAAKNDEIKSTLTSNLEDVQKELDKTKTKIINMEKDHETEKETILKRKDNEITELKQQLEVAAENVSKQEIQTQAHKQVLDQITMEKEAVQFEKEKVEKQVKRLESERDSLNSELIQLKVEATKSQTNVDQAAQERAKAEEKIQDITEEKERVEKMLAGLQKSKDEAVSEREKITAEKDQFQKETMEGRAALQQKDMLVEELQKEVERLKQESSQQQETINQLSQATEDSGTMQKKLAEQMSIVEMWKKKVTDLEAASQEAKKKSEEQQGEVKAIKIELEEAQETVTLLEENVKDLEQEKDSLTSQLQGALEARKEQDKVLGLNQKLNEEIESIQQRHRSEVESLLSAKESLQQEVDNTTSLFEQKESELKAKVLQISNLENENSMLIGYKSSKEKLEQETSELRGKINKLQSQLTESQSNANIINNIDTTSVNTGGSSALIEQLKEENLTAQGQVDFLNSVIVDLQHKNEELKTRLEAMEQGVTNGADDSMETTTTRRAAPRVFCDICDVFDQHETEDCPLQEMSDSPPPSQYHGERHQIRPYCDICEEFHPPCPGLSVKKVAASGAEPIDPKAKVEDWVKTVDTVTSELVSESEKVFGNDGEFFHVQQDVHETPGFRDSGYYDGIVDSNLKSPFDVKPGLLSSVTELSDKDKQDIWEKLKKEATKCEHLINEEYSSVYKDLNETNENGSEKLKLIADTGNNVKDRPNTLETARATEDTSASKSSFLKTPVSLTSASDSEYQSGKESLDSDSPVGAGTPDLETSVDTGEVFQAENSDENATEKGGKSDTDQAADNCTIS
ncbi:CAP-Gly domain-containing linker protein 1-like isoform X3 [Mercenaria mercenaria]|uniref:CAP-Gly domain-containing linker protein 1-like isoform X3 n=1 Tax=Mercenaria mercenaria TaxID=6596 RepID=UPI00234E6669|nr:CAP-Gly domain-containing linker protein 1-like isoform X3 [Mercenaria mercenaria]